MKTKIPSALRVLSLIILCSVAFPLGAVAQSKPAPVVMLKLDDLVRSKPGSTLAVSDHWQRVVAFLESQKLKASYGILAISLEGDCPAYVDWLKKRVAAGSEIWLHGYYAFGGIPTALKVNGRTAEFVGGTAADQAVGINRSLKLVKEKVGVDIAAFGPHATPMDAATYEVLEGLPQIHAVWFYPPPAGTKTSKLVIQRLMNLESPIFVPNYEKVKADFEQKRATLPYVAVQGHPDTWDDAKFENFKKVVSYLRDQGCKFVTISDYVASQAGAGKPQP